MFDLTDVSYVKRIVVGSRDPESLRSEDEIKSAMDLLNRWNVRYFVAHKPGYGESVNAPVALMTTLALISKLSPVSTSCHVTPWMMLSAPFCSEVTLA